MFLQKEGEHLMFRQKSLSQWVLQNSFETLCYELFEPPSSPHQSVAFHEQGLEHRSRLAQTLGERRPLFAPVMATLQSLASSLTVYQHDWAYFNQLLMSFSAFFQEDLGFYEQFEQQLFIAGARQPLALPDLPYVSALMNLWAIQGDDPVWGLLQIYAKAQIEMPAAIASSIALMSARPKIGEWTGFTPWVENLPFNRLQLTALKEIENRGSLPGFIQGSLQDAEKYLLGKQVAEQLSLQSEVFYPIFQALLILESVAESQDLSPRWEIYPVAALCSLGLYPNWIAPWMVFCRLPQQIAQYRLYEQECASNALGGFF